MGRFKAHSGMYATMYSLGLMDKWNSGYMKGGNYQTAIQLGDYKVEYFDDETETQLTIWNPDRPCIVIVLLKDMEMAVLNVVKYDQRCTIDGRMEKGVGTRNMIKFALDLIKNAGAKSIQLDDDSTVKCNGKNIKLGPMYFLKYGVTWYEKYFGFQPLQNKEIYKRAKDIQKTLGLEDKPCDYFTDEVVYELMHKTGLDKVIGNGWEKIF
jgi:hypothetical protein